MKEKLVLIDANSLIHRAFHALPPFKTKDGELVNAVYGFCSMLITVLSKLMPEYIVVSFDVAKKTFRHEEFEQYKATRVKAPDELYEQFDRIREIINTLNIPVFEKEGYEADDVIATIAEKMKKHPDVEIYIVTGDKDAFQLIDKQTFILSPKKEKGENIIFKEDDIKERYGLDTNQIIDFKALTGDPSDNIPGVAGIGDKTAISLLQKYKTLDGIYEHINEITGALHEKLKNGKEDAYFSKKLVRLVKDIPLDFHLDDAKIHPQDFNDVMPLFEELQFKSLIGRLKKILPEIQENPAQTSLF